ncbi:hypothetical protein SAMN02745207_01264 [Clostridium grantii DSM 8605]|uniref:Uncharacterized protein n=1 Tax=Clostridium grantii DSM 8605 TaxID=1121316 RepID=A0A1M5T9F6_9CLOT|nr:hypothetical protein SAMN02745207_01264 [Clostridium grantii DSM 8605]
MIFNSILLKFESKTKINFAKRIFSIKRTRFSIVETCSFFSPYGSFFNFFFLFFTLYLLVISSDPLFLYFYFFPLLLHLHPICIGFHPSQNLSLSCSRFVHNCLDYFYNFPQGSGPFARGNALCPELASLAELIAQLFTFRSQWLGLFYQFSPRVWPHCEGNALCPELAHNSS